MSHFSKFIKMKKTSNNNPDMQSNNTSEFALLRVPNLKRECYLIFGVWGQNGIYDKFLQIGLIFDPTIIWGLFGVILGAK